MVRNTKSIDKRPAHRPATSTTAGGQRPGSAGSSSSSTNSGLQPCCVTADAPLTLGDTGRFKYAMGKCMCRLIGECGEIVTQTWTSHPPTYAQDASISCISVLKALGSVRKYACTYVQNSSLVLGRPLPATVVILTLTFVRSFGGISPERKASQALQSLFTFVSAK
jgi:hypothetical protein